MKDFTTWLYGSAYFLVLSILTTYVFLTGLGYIQGAGNTGVGVLLIALAVAGGYVATAYFLKEAPPRFFGGASSRTFSHSVRALPCLIGVFAVYAACFAALSGIASLIAFQAISPSDPETASGWASIFVICLALLTLPFIIFSFAGFANGEKGFAALLKGSLHMGCPMYLKYLAAGAASLGLAYLIRLFAGGAIEPIGTIATLVLSSIVLGAALLLAWRLFAGKAQKR